VFYAGGTNSVRGWSRESLGPKRPFLEVEEDGSETFRGYLPTGGRALFTSSIEARYSLDHRWKGVGIATFLDAGQVWTSFSNMEERSLQFGTGVGIRYESVIGPIRLDIAWKVNPNADDLNRFEGQDVGNALRRFGFHLNIGSPF
jgi:outer membrane protein insertion porin family